MYLKVGAQLYKTCTPVELDLSMKQYNGDAIAGGAVSALWFYTKSKQSYQVKTHHNNKHL